MSSKPWLHTVSLSAAVSLLACSGDAPGKSAPPESTAGGSALSGASGANLPSAAGGAAGASRPASAGTGATTAPAAGARSSAGIEGHAGAAGVAGASGGSPATMAAVAGSPSTAAIGGNTAPGTAGSAAAGGSAGNAGSNAAGTASGAPATEGCTGKPGKLKGKSQQRVTIDGTARTYVHYAPKDLDPNKPVPLLIVPHGYTQSGEDMFAITKYPQLADREGFVAVFPDGGRKGPGPWSVGSGVCGAGSAVPGRDDDQAFVDAMIALAASDQCIDRSHIFMSGWSMGGYFSHETACTRDEIRAIGPHSAGSHDLGGCPTKHKPVIMFHFNPDGLISYPCGQEARDRWIKRNGCQADAPQIEMVQGGSCEYYKGCPADGQVAFCSFEIPPNHRADFLAGHAWSGGTPHSYSIAETESAAELTWKFFKTYAW